jgi:hypothetical protein
MSEYWKDHSTCSECGGNLDKVEVDMGFSERIPRVLTIGGAGFTVLAVIYLVVKMATDGIGHREGTTTTILISIGIGFLFASLVFRWRMTEIAKTRAEAAATSRKLKRVKRPVGDQGEVVRSGEVKDPVRTRASKIPVRRK